MSETKTYYLQPTGRIPNSPYPLVHYRGLLREKAGDAAKAYDLFTGNGWKVSWIFRYGNTQTSHYHSRAHECMAVLSGNATIRFGVADTSEDMHENTYGSSWEKGGIEIEASVGDVFIIPAGVAHKTYSAMPEAPFVLLTPGTGKGIEAPDPRDAISKVQLDGFTMLGAYPQGASEWDFAVGDTDHSDWDTVWSIEKPENDPVLGGSSSGLCGLWKSRYDQY